MDNQKNGRINDIKVPVMVSIGKSMMSLEELANMGSGTIVGLDKPAGDPADLYVSGELVAKGRVVVIDEMFALRITEVLNPQEATYGK